MVHRRTDRLLKHALARELLLPDPGLLAVQFQPRLASLVALAACLSRLVYQHSRLAHCLSLAQIRFGRLLEARFVSVDVHR